MTSIGQYRVGLDFNPSGNSVVQEIKERTAELIDLCMLIGEGNPNPEAVRLCALAMTHYEDAAMWAVKAATKRPREGY